MKDAKVIWSKMMDTNDRMPMTHDGYLKLHQLQGNQIRGYDVILIDEAQDLTPG